jgi:hypothetical protein
MIKSLKLTTLLTSGFVLIQPIFISYASASEVQQNLPYSPSVGLWQKPPPVDVKDNKPPACTPDPNTGQCPSPAPKPKST